MPRNVRNFWVEVQVDGRKTNIATGPVRKDGGMFILLKVRERREARVLGAVNCYHEDGKNIVNVDFAEFNETYAFER